MVLWRVIVCTGRILMFPFFLLPRGILGRKIILCHIITSPLPLPTVYPSFTGLFIMLSHDAGFCCVVSPLPPPFLSLHKFLLQKQSLERFLISEILGVSWIASAFNRMLARNWVNANGVLEEEVLLQVYLHRYLRHWQEESIIHYCDRGVFLYWKKEGSYGVWGDSACFGHFLQTVIDLSKLLWLSRQGHLSYWGCKVHLETIRSDT